MSLSAIDDLLFVPKGVGGGGGDGKGNSMASSNFYGQDDYF